MNPFGASSSITDNTPSELKNEFNTIPNNDISNIIDSNRVEPRQVGTGVTRGTWRMNNTDGSYITIGLIPNTDNEFGIAYFKSDNTRIFTIDATGFLFSDSTVRRIKIGAAPDDGRIGIWTSKPNEDVITLLES